MCCFIHGEVQFRLWVPNFGTLEKILIRITGKMENKSKKANKTKVPKIGDVLKNNFELCQR